MSGFALFICLLLLPFPGGCRQAKGHWPLPLGPLSGKMKIRGRLGVESGLTKEPGSARSLFIRKLETSTVTKAGPGSAEAAEIREAHGLELMPQTLEKLRTLSDDSQVCLEVCRSHTKPCSQTAKDACGLWTNVTNSSLHFLKDGNFGRIFSLKLKIVFLSGYTPCLSSLG